MLWYSNAAIDYAIARCIEKPGYKVVIAYGRDKEEQDAFYEKLQFEETISRIRCAGGNIDVTFNNGSKIDWVSPTENSRGHRAHLVIMRYDVPDETIRCVFEPMEILEWMERKSFY